MVYKFISNSSVTYDSINSCDVSIDMHMVLSFFSPQDTVVLCEKTYDNTKETHALWE